MTKDHFRMKVAVYGIIRNPNGQVLLHQRQNSGFMDGYFGLPAGHLDGGESPSEALSREVKEETNLHINPQQWRQVFTIHRLSKQGITDEYVDIFFEVRDITQEPQIMEPEKHSNLGYFDENELPKNTITYIRDVISRIARGETYHEYGAGEGLK
ncbi:NUDIX domain-containing protein [Candidatus Saccharibacteria bacterium]|nr:NUDIX domain-containing protein [Candidatus Saccharibacteria bacterium]